MSNRLTTWLSMLFIGILFCALVLLNNQLLSNYRVDLTEDNVYSLSEGSQQILTEIDEPLNLYFFFSDKASKNMITLRNYAMRVQSLLEEYASRSNGKIKLHILDPEAFSEKEDRADQFGLTAANIGAAGEAVYLGLGATNALDDQQVIAFFDPQQERFLEYEISKLIYQLVNPKQVKVTLLTDLPVAGGQNPMTGGFDQPWTFYTQLQQLYVVEKIGSDASELPKGTDVLIVAHPKNLSDELLYAIDQYTMDGGRALIFIDPHNESDQMSMLTGASTGANSSNLMRLFDTWGVNFNEQQVLLDAFAGLDVRTQTGDVTRHFGFVGFGANELNDKDVTTSSLDLINGASFGVFNKEGNSSLSWSTLLHSTKNSDLIDSALYAQTRDPQVLSQEYKSDNKEYILATRLTGSVKSAFEYAPEGIDEQGHLRQTRDFNVILVGDTDLLSDRFWVQQSSFFGETITTPFANNGDFVTNVVENLAGSNALISIRSRGTFARPFDKVDQLKLVAEQKFREQEKILQQQLDETESQLAQLQEQQGEGGALVISAQQQEAIDDFMEQKIQIRKSLRDVRHQLDKDIEKLGNLVKFGNIVVAPLILVLFLMLGRRLLRSRYKPNRHTPVNAKEGQS
ncbi:Gldg family protein [Paraglaciecola sp. L1A13]|uniref:GldG family protein n=1 Tax=Paraglaciecola sp. L1A13 TaxID=2686359 RepID=UPI00131B0DEE|nr:Gldg family protein [Paraglaciecola sp. L1A13]